MVCHMVETGATAKRYISCGVSKSNLGRGGFGAVGLGWDTQNGCLVALKRQKRDSDVAVRELNFYRAVPEHPHLLKLIDVFVSQSSALD